MSWEVEYTSEFEAWWLDLSDEQQEAITARVELLMDHGPALGRPTVAEIDGSRIKNLKELRCSKDGALRILFAFDPLSTAILLLGGDKSLKWNEWYRTAIPEAERLFEEHLAELEEEGWLPP